VRNPTTAWATAAGGREDGIALITVLMLTVILTVIGIAAFTTTSLDVQMAGGEKLREVTTNAGEACLSSGVQIIQQTMQNGVLPTTITNPVINNPSTLLSEILGSSAGNPDSADPTSATPAPNAVLYIPTAANPTYTVNMDIDYLYQTNAGGGNMGMNQGYEGAGQGAVSSGMKNLYRIDCYAWNTSGPVLARSHVTGVYACAKTGSSCQPKL